MSVTVGELLLFVFACSLVLSLQNSVRHIIKYKQIHAGRYKYCGMHESVNNMQSSKMMVHILAGIC